MDIENFLIGDKPYEQEGDAPKVGFLIRRTEVDSNAFLEETPRDKCLLDDTSVLDADRDTVVDIKNSKATTRDTLVRAGQEGFYNVFFVNCLDEPASFELKLVQYNVLPNGDVTYLSAGRVPLPTLYATLCVFYVSLLLVWLVFFVKSSNAVNQVHHLMSLLLFLKMLSLLFKTIDYHYQSSVGMAGGWGIVYYAFAGAKGLLMFVLIALIGTGWKFVKPFLAEKDKRIFMIVIPLQLLDNIALIVIEETAPGSIGFFEWKDVFRLVDILCCGAILIPIIWSIKHLREASEIDGKAARNLQKLKLFRQFYLMVVSYVYTTRILIYLLDATLPFRYVWLGDLCAEAATCVFFMWSGWMFRPIPENPYFKLEADTDDGGENGEKSKKAGNRSGVKKGASGVSV